MNKLSARARFVQRTFHLNYVRGRRTYAAMRKVLREVITGRVARGAVQEFALKWACSSSKTAALTGCSCHVSVEFKPDADKRLLCRKGARGKSGR